MTTFQFRPLTMVEFHRIRENAKNSRKKLIKQNPRSVYFLEPVHGGWAIYKGG